MQLGNGLSAVVPIFFPNEVDLIHGHLSKNSKRAIFIQPTSIPTEKCWFGKAVFELNKKIIFPDSVSIETKIGESQPRHSYSRDGIHFENEAGLKVIGYQKENKILESSWNLPMADWT